MAKKKTRARPAEADPRRSRTFRLPDSVMETLTEIAEIQGITRTSVIIGMIEDRKAMLDRLEARRAKAHAEA